MIHEVIESLPDALLVVGKEGQIVNANSLVTAMFGYHRNDIVGRGVEMLIPERFRRTHAKDRANYFLDPQVRPMNKSMGLYGLHSQGFEFAIEIFLSPLQENGEISALAAIRDIRAHKKMEEELRHAKYALEKRVEERTAELTHINESLRLEMLERERMVEKARQLNVELAHVSRLSVLGEMTSSMAHELNQPLAAISNYIQGCVRRLDNSEVDVQSLIPALKRATTEASRAAEIITRFRQFGRKDAFQKRSVWVDGLVGNAVELERFEAEIHRLKIQVKMQEKLPQVSVDEIQIQQVIINLLRNAIEATDAVAGTQQPILVEVVRWSDDQVKVAVIDRGNGLTKKQLAHLFEPFYTTKSAGLGMGLSISRSIIEAHDGRLWAESNPAGGASFFFTLPIVDKYK